jgi:membrane protein implicated in regulation of membrane protease activity
MTMPRIRTQSFASNPDPRLSRTLWQWLTLGVLAMALFPGARGFGLWLGWGPFWALIAPLLALSVLHRQVLKAAWRMLLVRAPRRRRQRNVSTQARRAGFGPVARRQSQHAA